MVRKNIDKKLKYAENKHGQKNTYIIRATVQPNLQKIRTKLVFIVCNIL